jgi:hypothetical protein
VKLNDIELLSAEAQVLNAGPQESRDADHAAVKRILDSIKPMNLPTTAVATQVITGITTDNKR